MKLIRPATDDVREKFATARRELSAALIERDEEVDLVLTALVASEHVLLVGPPGCGKRLLLDAVLSVDRRHASSRSCSPSSPSPRRCFGPVSLAGLKEDRYVRVTDRQAARGRLRLPRRGVQGVSRPS